jgi:ATP-dependent DNA helicase DinG
MAEAVAAAFSHGTVLLAEAGTGIGKTLAYLVPGVLSRQRVLISTGTKNLQEQIYFKDLPVVAAALDVPFTATYMKGRGNYLCRLRFEEVRQEPASWLAAGEFIRRIGEWSRATDTGDRAELNDLPEDLPFWNEVAASSENCVGKDCPQYDDCFVTRMRLQAASSDLVIVNHHLLCADASVRQGAYGAVIPECAYAVVDEAHQLEDVATQYFGVAVSNHRVEALCRDADRTVATRQVADPDGHWRRAVDRIRDAASAFFIDLSFGAQRAWAGARLREAASRRGATEAREPGGGGDARVRVTAESLGDCHDTGQHLIEALDLLEGTVELTREIGEPARAIGRRAGEARDQLQFLLRASDPDHVYFVETRGRGVHLRATPIDVSSIIGDVLFDRLAATVLTSATLSVGGSFDYVRGRLGVPRGPEVRLPSEFDYRRQALLYLPPDLPDPKSPDFADEAGRVVVEILRRTSGRAFVLFTSYAVLHRVRAVVEASLPYPLLVQGSAPRSALLQQFRSTPHAVLLATSSFWQGVDVVGESLSCVIIDKLPFASPGDPITAARLEAIEARGGDPFNDYQVPLAVLTLLQGLGRLIRHRQDRGVLAILDPRLRTRGYGRRFLDALPPAPVTMRLEDIEQFF